MIGALIGSLVEVSGFQPVFPTPSDDIAAAIARERPAVVLVDCDAGDEERCTEPVAAYGGAVILFSPWRAAADVEAIAARLGLRHFALPIAWTAFRRLLREAIGARGDA
jgi:MinD-like ATPase involved in chromosome partitioning or flagellar assembly